ncbi:MAG: hypothetical protein V4550_07360 [Gemmatimonadota bacterium]
MNDQEMDSALQTLVSEAHDIGTPRFGEGFADRVLARVAADRLATSQSVATSLNRQAVRVLPALLAASIALIAWNLRSAGGSSDSTFAAALGLQPVTIAAAVGSGAMLGAESLQ